MLWRTDETMSHKIYSILWVFIAYLVSNCYFSYFKLSFDWNLNKIFNVYETDCRFAINSQLVSPFRVPVLFAVIHCKPDFCPLSCVLDRGKYIDLRKEYIFIDFWVFYDYTDYDSNFIENWAWKMSMAKYHRVCSAQNLASSNRVWFCTLFFW